MKSFIYKKNIYKLLIKYVLFFVIIVFNLLAESNYIFAGIIFYEGNQMMYKTDEGILAKDIWVWLDVNNDSIAECYRFDSDGHIAKNYKDENNRETNEEGQLIEDNIVIRKMLSNGKILKEDKRPEGIFSIIGNILNPNGDKKKKDKYGKEVKEYETLPSKFLKAEEGIINKVKYNGDNGIKPAEVADGGIIYSNGKNSEIKDNVKEESTDNHKIVAGKDFRRYITSRNKCTEKKDNCYIYGGSIWNDCIELSGNGAYVKLSLNGNNYMYFEVAEEVHYSGDDAKDTDICLELYENGQLIDSIDEFVEGSPIEIVEEELDDIKNIELKVKIESGQKGRKVYIRNGRFRKVKYDD